jgi:hypothetical protein
MMDDAVEPSSLLYRSGHAAPGCHLAARRQIGQEIAKLRRHLDAMEYVEEIGEITGWWDRRAGP